MLYSTHTQHFPTPAPPGWIGHKLVEVHLREPHRAEQDIRRARNNLFCPRNQPKKQSASGLDVEKVGTRFSLSEWFAERARC